MTWTKVGANDYGDVYRIEPGYIITGYLCSGDTEPSWVERFAMPGPWSSLGQLRVAHERAGRFYFSRGATSFFGARYNEVIGGRLLIDSALPPDGVRQYRVSVWDDHAITCHRIGVFANLSQARRFAREVVALCNLVTQ